MSAAPVFFVTLRQGSANSTGSANSDKSRASANNLATVVTGSANGSIIQKVTVVQNVAAASTASCIFRAYIHDGTNFDLVYEKNLGGSVTPSATVIGIREVASELVGLKLVSASYSLRVGFSAAAAGDSFTVRAEVGDL